MIDDDGAIIAPGAFLPVAERRGMIRTIDRWVIGQAVELLEDLTTSDGAVAAGAAPLRLHVNVSARSLSDGDFLGHVAGRLDRSRIDPSQLVFEITETAAIANVDDACRLLRACPSSAAPSRSTTSAPGSARCSTSGPAGGLLKIDGQFIREPHDEPRRSRRRRVAGTDGPRAAEAHDRRVRRGRRHAGAPCRPRRRPRAGLPHRQAGTGSPGHPRAANDSAPRSLATPARLTFLRPSHRRSARAELVVTADVRGA